MPRVDLIQPSYLNGFAPRDGRSIVPLLWNGCVIAMHPGLGITGNAILYDWSGFGNHGTINNLATTGWANDEIGQVLELNATNDSIKIPYSESFASKTYSWSIWVKSTEVGGNLGLISRWQNDSGTYSWTVTWENTSVYWYQAGLTGLSSGTINQNDGKWHHLCGTYDKITTRIYMDGVQVASVANTSDYTVTTQSLVLGTYATTQDWDGKLSSFALWNRALLPNEVTLLASDPSIMYRLESLRLKMGIASPPPPPPILPQYPIFGSFIT